MNFKYENQKRKQGYAHIIGCDEVGRGSLAGSVVAAAVTIRKGMRYKGIGIKDSKLLTAERREELAEVIKQNFLWSIGEVSQGVIDKINIHNATLLAMKKAVESLQSAYSYQFVGNRIAVIDGKFIIPDLDLHQEAVVDGDNKILSIAAASIIAKVHRDSLMRKLHNKHPIYNFAQHKGYGTFYHRQMILQNGLSPIHRVSFCSHII